MDPNATLSAMLVAIADGDVDTANDAFDNLREWIGHRGYAPDAISDFVTELHSIGAHADGVNGHDDDGDAIAVRIFLADSVPGIRFCCGDPSYDTDHRGYCGASHYDTAGGVRGAVDCILEAIGDAMEGFYFANIVR